MVQRTVRRLDELDLPLPDKPHSLNQELPDDLTEFTSENLSQLMTTSANWLAYAGGQVALAEMEETEAEKLLAKAQARAAVLAKAEKTVAAQKAVAADDPRVQAAQQAVADAYAFRKGLEAVYSGMEVKGRVISRELTRRTGIRDVENRVGKWTT